jgi:hypothetical protein
MKLPILQPTSGIIVVSSRFGSHANANHKREQQRDILFPVSLFVFI